jgi:hypothetical protein
MYQLATDPMDVLLFGESTLSYVGPEEADQRSVSDLVAEYLHPLSTYTLAGPGYGMSLHTEYLRLASSIPARPVIVHTLWLRGTFPAFLRHPQYGHRRALDRLRSTTPAVMGELFDRRRVPTTEDYKRFELLPYPTIVGERSIADFMRALREECMPDHPDYWRWMFEFHWGGSPEDEGLQAFTDFGRILRDSGYPVVAFQNPVNVTAGCAELGPEFAHWHARNEQAVLDAYRTGFGEDAVVLETGDLWEPEDFIDPALEHLGAAARARLAGLIADAVLDVADDELGQIPA